MEAAPIAVVHPSVFSGRTWLAKCEQRRLGCKQGASLTGEQRKQTACPRSAMHEHIPLPRLPATCKDERWDLSECRSSMPSAADASEVLAWEDLPLPASGMHRTSEYTPPARRRWGYSPPRPHLGNTGAAKGLRARTKGACCYCTPCMTRPRYQRACVAREARDANQMYAGSVAPLDVISFWDSMSDGMEEDTYSSHDPGSPGWRLQQQRQALSGLLRCSLMLCSRVSFIANEECLQKRPGPDGSCLDCCCSSISLLKPRMIWNIWQTSSGPGRFASLTGKLKLENLLHSAMPRHIPPLRLPANCSS